ncbi:restriction endonuclease, SacI family [Tissierella sp. MSJ-40]|uniref:Restriction endonuclease, SacI family n=1 Tax=Tissierella simiarum TaxID=2841534 RepID=A0ABS6ECA2_9FIRM|nr:restriction endonuclease, SacI family [Tissierella simiarum]MBU5439808.1 restriction endonuclease, SacI family [Tissierella simiarum]
MRLNQENAKSVLYRAYDIAQNSHLVNCPLSEFFDFVLNNTHLTYKYILFTAILAKATDESINPLCLQVKSELPGAYDARSICHKVIVPFEMEVLQKALGGSNEPFLNKPARFPELSKNNAVRRGNDQRILNALCDFLPQITNDEIAFNCLVYILQKLIVMRDEKLNLVNFTLADGNNSKATLYKFILNLLKSSFEGETLTLVVAGLYAQYLALDASYKVEVHPVNQSGASGREISDLDIYYNNSLYIANELKDKPYTESDIRHAADKVIQSGGTQLIFIDGLHSYCEPTIKLSIEEEYLKRGFLLEIISVTHFAKTIITYTMEINIELFVKYIIEIALNTKFKQEAISYILQSAEELLGLTFNS